MEVLQQIREDAGSLGDYRWFEIFVSKCRALDINLEQPNLLRDAQKLLKSPLARLKGYMEEVQNG
jgi:hypothetical protein